MQGDATERLKLIQKLVDGNSRSYRIGLWLLYSDIATNRKGLKASCMLDDEGIVELLVGLGKGMKEYSEVSHRYPQLKMLFDGGAGTVIGAIKKYRENNNISEQPFELEKMEQFMIARFKEETEKERAMQQRKAPELEFEDDPEEELEDEDNGAEIEFEDVEEFEVGTEEETEDEDSDTGIEFEEPKATVEPIKAEEPEEIEIDDWELDSYTNRLMNILTDLYSSAYDVGRPFGIATRDGYITIDKNTNQVVYKRVKALSTLMEMIEYSSKIKFRCKPVSKGMTLESIQQLGFSNEYNYYPEFYTSILYGFIDNNHYIKWGDVAEILRLRIRETIKRYLIKGYKLDTIVNALGTAVIVYKYDSSMSLRITVNVGNGGFNTKNFETVYNRSKSSIFAGNGELFGLKSKGTGVSTFDLVFDKSAYYMAPMFGYKAVELLQQKDQAPSIKNFILGEDEDGNTFTTNLCRQDAGKIVIAAGARSGKGVFTLNLLGTILASACPLIYLDYKPDMAVIIRDIGNKYGVPTAVYDGTVGWKPTVRRSDGTQVTIKKGDGAPSEVLDKYSTLISGLVYYKVLQLMLYASQMAVDEKLDVSKRPFFIFDEVYALQKGTKSDLIRLGEDSTDKEISGEVSKWAKGIGQWLRDVDGSFGSGLDSQMPKSGITTVYLCQSFSPYEWSANNAQIQKRVFNPFSKIISSGTSLKVLGRGVFNSEYALSNVKNITRIKQRVDNRWFAYATSQKIMGEEDVKVFKPYLVLNESTVGAECVTEFKATLREKNISVAPFTVDNTEDGELDSRAGLEGFMQAIGKDAIPNLRLGKEFMDTLMKLSGLDKEFDSLEEYLYCGRLDSFYTLGQLTKGIGNSSESSEELSGMEDGTEESDIFDSTMGGTLGEQTSTQREQISNQGGVLGEQTGINAMQENSFGNEQMFSSTPQENSLEDEQMFSSIPQENTQIDRNTAQQPITQEDIEAVYREELKSNPSPTVLMPNKNRMVTEQVGRNVVVDTNGTQNARPMVNAIDCSGAYEGPSKWFESVFMRGNVDKYTDGRWSAILDRVEMAVNPNEVRRVYIYNTSMFINRRLCNLNGVLGGENGVTLGDIVNYKLLARKFKHIREMALDYDTMKSGYIEFGIDSDVIAEIFKLNSELLTINIVGPNNVEVVSRKEVLSNIGNSNKSAESVKIGAKMDIDRPSDDSIYKGRIARKCGSNARNSFKDGKHIITGTLWGAAAAVTGLVGGMIWGVKSAFGSRKQ